MAIDAIQIENIMAFRHDTAKAADYSRFKDIIPGDLFLRSFAIRFSDNINLLIGTNGTGKSTILKMIYSSTQYSNGLSSAAYFFAEYFSSGMTDSILLKNEREDKMIRRFSVYSGRYSYSYYVGNSHLPYGSHFCDTAWTTLHIPSVFIPAQEMLSHAPGFLALYHKMKIPFDRTLADIIANASLPEARTLPPYMDAVLDKISAAVGGTVVQENDTFYVLKEGGEKIEFSLEAEGLRKLGLLWKLIRNGLLNEGSVLLWDEPEANLNPELFPLVADILLELTRNGVQIFAATHSYNFAKYLEIRRGKPEDVTFHNLVKNNAGGIDAFTASTMEGLPRNPIMEADLKLLDEVFQAG